MLVLCMNALQKPDMKAMKRYYVELDNIITPSHLRGLKAFEAVNTSELLDQIIEFYGLKWDYKNSLQLWSNKSGLPRERLDSMECIPDKYEFIYVRGVRNNNK